MNNIHYATFRVIRENVHRDVWWGRQRYYTRQKRLSLSTLYVISNNCVTDRLPEDIQEDIVRQVILERKRRNEILSNSNV